MVLEKEVMVTAKMSTMWHSKLCFWEMSTML